MHGFFSVPVDHLHALRELAEHFRQRDLSQTVVLSPDLGYAKSAAAFARRLGVPVAAGAKERFSDDKVSISAIIGEVADRDVIILDDEIARGTTVLELLSVLRRQEPRSISIACTHGLFADGALEKLAAAEDVSEVVCTNSVPVPVCASRSSRCCPWPRPGRGHQADPRRRVGQRPVRALAASRQRKRHSPRRQLPPGAVPGASGRDSAQPRYGQPKRFGPGCPAAQQDDHDDRADDRDQPDQEHPARLVGVVQPADAHGQAGQPDDDQDEADQQGGPTSRPRAEMICSTTSTMNRASAYHQ